MLPPKCLVILEDIDAIGNARKMDIKDKEAAKAGPGAKGKDGEKDKDKKDDDSDDDSEEDGPSNSQARCTLSGLLNVLDGVSSQEGRILFMTSNVAHKLDKALIRPGRIDKMIYLAEMSKDSARLMFLRMYARSNNGSSAYGEIDEKLEKLALEFENAVPDKTLTPAQLQGYILKHRQDPKAAVAGISTWVADEKTMKEQAKERTKKAKTEKNEAAKKKKEEDEKKAADAKTAEEQGKAVKELIATRLADLEKAAEEALSNHKSSSETEKQPATVTIMKEVESKEDKSTGDIKESTAKEKEALDASKGESKSS